MRTEETLLLQALKLKQLNDCGYSGDGDLIDHIVSQNPEESKKLRNICAFISPELFDDVANVCSILKLSKRQVVEMALIDVMEKAHKIINDTEALKGAEVH